MNANCPLWGSTKRYTRTGHYERKLQTKAGEVRLKIPKLRAQTFEWACPRPPSSNANIGARVSFGCDASALRQAVIAPSCLILLGDSRRFRGLGDCEKRWLVTLSRILLRTGLSIIALRVV